MSEFIKDLSGKPINLSLLQNIVINSDDPSELDYVMMNGDIVPEKFSSAQEAQSRLENLIAVITADDGNNQGLIDQLQATITQQQATINTLNQDITEVNGETVEGDSADYLLETKSLIRQSIISKGQPVLETDPFREYPNKILDIQTGVDTDDATATADDILMNKIAYARGQKLTGTITTEYGSAGIVLDKAINNSDSLNIFDINYSLGYALVGTRGETNFYLAKLSENSLDTSNLIEFSIPDVSNTYPYILSDLKFNFDDALNNKLTFYGVGVYYHRVSRQPCWREVLFGITYDITTGEHEVLSMDINDLGANDQLYGSNTYFQLNVIDKNVVLLKPEHYNRHNYYTHLSAVRTRRIYQIDTSITQLSTLDMGNDTWALDTTIADVKKWIYVEYNASKYRIYRLSNTYGFTKIKDGSDNATKRVAAVDNTHYLYGSELYDNYNNLVTDYTDILSPTTYKLCVEGYIFSIDPTNSLIQVYSINELYEIELIGTISNHINTYDLNSVYINRRAQLGYNSIGYGLSTGLTISYTSYLGQSETIDSVTIGDIKYRNTSDASALANEILRGKTAYVNGEKITGTCPAVGSINFRGNNFIITPSADKVHIKTQYVPSVGDTEKFIINTTSNVIMEVPDEILASSIGLTADKIKAGEIILDITGTYEGSSSGGNGSVFMEPTDSIHSLVNLMTVAPMLDLSTLTTMNSMFSGLGGLTTIPLYDTSNVTNMQMTFNNCFALATVPLLDMSNVTKADNMFTSCSSLTEIPLLDTSNCTSMSGMFANCTGLTTIPLLNTSNCTTMGAIFNGCTSLTEIPLLDTSKVTNMSSMFYKCTSLTEIPLLDTSNVTAIGAMFASCTSLTEIPLLDTSKVTNMQSTFSGCTSLTSIPQLNTSNCTNLYATFEGCTNLVNIPVLDTSKVTSMSRAFRDCNSLSNDSLNNILTMCTNSVVTSTSNKKLSYIGLSSEQIEVCKTLSNYDAFIAAGWLAS